VGRALYERPPPDSFYAAMGFKPSDIPDEEVEVLPDNWEPFLLFNAMSTQWRTGANGVTGMDYNAIPIVVSSMDFEEPDMKVLLPAFRAMESSVLSYFEEERAKAEKKKK